MSLNRLALRLGAVLALTNNASEPWPTVAQGRVWDSRMEPAQIATDAERQPYCIVYTDDDRGEDLSANNGGPPFRRQIDLAIHFAVGAHGVLTDPDTGSEIPIFGAIESDAEVESVLDLFEHQIERALFGPSPWAGVFQDLIIRATQKVSIRFADPKEARVKYAERMITYRLDMRDDWIDADGVVHLADSPNDPPPAAALPPHLQQIVDATAGVAASPYVAQVVSILTAAGLPAPFAALRLKSLRLIEDERDAQDRRTNPRSQGDEPGVADVTLD